MRIRFVGFLASLVILTAICTAPLRAADGLPVARIGIVTDGPWARYPEGVDLFKREILELTDGEFNVEFPADQTLDGNWTVSGVNRAIDRLLASRNIDVIIALGHVASNEICKRRKLAKPVIAPFVIDAKLQNLPLKAGASGIHNLSYINRFKSVGRDIQTFREISSFNSLAFLVEGHILQSIPELRKKARQIANEYTIDVHVVSVETSATKALENLPPSTDAVIVGTMFRLTSHEFQELIAGLVKRRLPSFSFWGRDEVEQGILASTTPSSSLQRLARGVAINVSDILRGEKAGTLSVALTMGEGLSLNMATARAIDVYPSLGILTDADLLNEERQDIERVLTLEKAVQEALTANLDLAAADRRVAAGAEQVLEARSGLLPQIEVNTQALMIDDDRARASAGVNPERRWTGSASATQLLYSEKAWSDYGVQKHSQDARIQGREAKRLDIIQAAATTYLEVLRAKTLERIQKDNLKLTRANLERARARESAGIAGPDEVYRWESEIANSRQAVLQAESRTLNAMNALNRILHRPLQEPFVAKGAKLDDPLLVVSSKLFYSLVNRPKNFQTFRAFMVQEGMEIAPELRQIDAQMAALGRNLIAAKRAYWLPTFSLEGGVTELFDDGGDGTRDTSSVLNDTDWSAGVKATFPLFSGGEKGATHRRRLEEVARLRIERSATAERIEQGILNAVNLIRASYPGIRLFDDAAEAANKNLKLVTDSYGRGTKSIIDLLDAQNLTLVADQQAANAVYVFLIDLMNLERAVGRFELFSGAEQRQDWLEKMDAFFKKDGVDLGIQ